MEGSSRGGKTISFAPEKNGAEGLIRGEGKEDLAIKQDRRKNDLSKTRHWYLNAVRIALPFRRGAAPKGRPVSPAGRGKKAANGIGPSAIDVPLDGEHEKESEKKLSPSSLVHCTDQKKGPKCDQNVSGNRCGYGPP